jgi:flagella basal body P-ring formation protein FlgA
LLLPSFLFASVKQEIINFYKSHYPTIQIEKISSNKPFPEKYSKIDFKLANYKMPSSTVIIDSKYYFYHIKAHINVYKANKIIKVNEAILPSVSLKSIPFRNFYSKPLTKIEPNLVASKIISKNAVINESNTKTRPLILKGENVNVIFENPNIEIYAKGTALDDAGKNDIIKVEINNKIYTGKVLENGNVIIK